MSSMLQSYHRLNRVTWTVQSAGCVDTSCRSGRPYLSPSNNAFGHSSEGPEAGIGAVSVVAKQLEIEVVCEPCFRGDHDNRPSCQTLVCHEFHWT